MIKNNLNSICPYFAMFPLDYPLEAIKDAGSKIILDPFCGRGTTNIAARLNGLFSVGIDSSRVAYAISSAKMVDVSPECIVKECQKILNSSSDIEIPEGEFWDMMYNPQTLQDICSLRRAFLENCESPERIALRGIMLGALHGPMKKDGTTSYFSNQFPRTFASKPGYSVKYWKEHGIKIPPKVNILDVIKIRANRYYSDTLPPAHGFILNEDSTKEHTFEKVCENLGKKPLFDTVITSPPYHGMNTYIPDQWIRNWFIGGPDHVDYSIKGQTSGRLSEFIHQLNKVWKNCERCCSEYAKMYIRFGEIGQRNCDPDEIICKTFDNTGWNVSSISCAGVPKKGRRSSELFLKSDLRAYKEIDVIVQLSDNV